MIQHQFRNDTDAAAVGFAKECLEIVQRAVRRVDTHIVRGIISIVFEWRRIEGQEPYGRDAEILQVIEFVSQSGEIANAIVVAVEERADVDLVDDSVPVPKRIVLEKEGFGKLRHRKNQLETEFLIAPESYPILKPE